MSADEVKMSAANGQNQQQETGPPATKQDAPKQPSKLKQLWEKTGLNWMILQMMFKGSLPPVIAIASYQADGWAAEFATLGYLVAIASVLGFCIMPRGKFLETMFLNTFSICLASSVNLLAVYCITQARLHTIRSPAELTTYNSSASAVCAIWLFAQVYSVNVLRAANLRFQFPVIVYSIFVMVICTNAPTFPTMAYGISFVRRLLIAFLSGFGIATGVHFVVFPTSSRKVVFKEMTGYLMLLKGDLALQTAYFASLEEVDPVALRRKREEEAAQTTKHTKTKDRGPQNPISTPASVKLKETFDKTIELHTKIHGDVTPAKREIAIGKLESHDITELWKLLQMLFVPVLGLNTSVEILRRRAEEQDWSHEGTSEQEKKTKSQQLHGVHFLMKQLHEPFAMMTAEIDAAIMHVLITLELVKPPKQKKEDVESLGDKAVPGSWGFAEAYRSKVDNFHKSKEKTLEAWCREHGIDLPPDFFDSTFVQPEKSFIRDEHVRERYQRELFFTLYLEYLLGRASAAVLDLVLWADKKKQDGRFKRYKVIFPGSKTVYRWFKSLFSMEDFTQESSYTMELNSSGNENVMLGEDFARRKDPEHLPPRNALEKVGHLIGKIPKFFRSDASAFGFRVACATMTIGIVAFLQASQRFFIEQRLLWAMIMVAISMQRLSGQSTLQFLMRVAGTFVAMIAAFVVWYIVDGHKPGVIVFLWIWIMCGYYVLLKMPKQPVVGVLSVVTTVLIVAYELQVRKIGEAASQRTGQPAYPIYELAPYRLATVAGGLLVAWIWTIFPFPVSETSEIRKDLGATLYLLSNFYSVVHEVVQSRIKGTDGNKDIKSTHAYNLDKARNEVFSKVMLLISTLRMNTAFSVFQLQIGGRFPREEYVGAIDCCSRILRYAALISYSSLTLSQYGEHGQESSQWSSDFRRLLTSVNSTSHQVTSLLAMLSSSISNGQPLPPYMEMPKPFQIIKKLEAIDSDLLSVRHVAEPEYSAFAVIQICAQCISVDLLELTKHVKNLVGVIDFSFHAIKTSAESTDSSSVDTDEEKGKGRFE